MMRFGHRRDRHHWLSNKHTLVTDATSHFEPPVQVPKLTPPELGNNHGSATFGRCLRDTGVAFNLKVWKEDLEIKNVDEKYDHSRDKKHWRRQGSGFTFESMISRDKSYAMASKDEKLNVVIPPVIPAHKRKTKKTFWQR